MEDFTIIKQLGEDGKDGIVSLVRFPNGLQCACKLFYQRNMFHHATSKGPQDLVREILHNLHVDLDKRRFFMEAMEARVVDVLNCNSVRFEKDLLDIMNQLDLLKILHNDGNALNLMLDKHDNLKIIDFGLSKKITPAVNRKWAGEPNVKVTYHMLKKGLNKYGIQIK